MKKIILLLLVYLAAGWIGARAQVAINTDGSPPDPSAMLDVQSTSKGVLIPRMSAVERLSIQSPHTGLLVYQIDAAKGFYYYADSNWIMIEKQCGETVYMEGVWQWYEGQNIHTIRIGSQCWMRENLHVPPSHCYSGDCNHTGSLYFWDEMMVGATVPGSRGICPSGFHIPTDYEWSILFSYLDSYTNSANEFLLPGIHGTDAGIKVKSTSYWTTPVSSPYYEDDLSGFDALGSGYYTNNYYGLNQESIFWTSSQIGQVFAYAYRILDNSGQVEKIELIKSSRACSVRCIKD
jgi:uncharacterized protein (TIGR02145 family)